MRGTSTRGPNWTPLPSNVILAAFRGEADVGLAGVNSVGSVFSRSACGPHGPGRDTCAWRGSATCPGQAVPLRRDRPTRRTARSGKSRAASATRRTRRRPTTACGEDGHRAIARGSGARNPAAAEPRKLRRGGPGCEPGLQSDAVGRGAKPFDDGRVGYPAAATAFLTSSHSRCRAA